jgi:hypothetical protein
MDRYLRQGRAGKRSRGRGRARLSEPDEFVSLEEENNFIERGEESSVDNSTYSEASESEGIPDSAYIGGKLVERPKLPNWYSKFYEPLLLPPPALNISVNSVVGRCKVCLLEKKERTFFSASLGSLTNLQRHVKRHHSSEWEAWEKSRVVQVAQVQPDQSTLQYESKTSMGKARQEELKCALATMIVIDNMPATSVAKPGLRHFVKVFHFFISINFLN